MDSSLDLLFAPVPTPEPDNTDPHPVTLKVYPREWRIPYAHQWEAEYEITIEHPATCPNTYGVCPVADYLDTVGLDEHFYTGFPEPDHLSDEDLAALDGTVRYVVITRTFSGYSDPSNGEGCDVEHAFTWSDQ